MINDLDWAALRREQDCLRAVMNDVRELRVQQIGQQVGRPSWTDELRGTLTTHLHAAKECERATMACYAETTASNQELNVALRRAAFRLGQRRREELVLLAAAAIAALEEGDLSRSFGCRSCQGHGCSTCGIG